MASLGHVRDGSKVKANSSSTSPMSYGRCGKRALCEEIEASAGISVPVPNFLRCDEEEPRYRDRLRVAGGLATTRTVWSG